MEQPRKNTGKFAAKGEANRSVKSIRVDDAIWEEFQNLALKDNLSCADLLEKWIKERREENLPILEEINRIEEEEKRIFQS